MVPLIIVSALVVALVALGVQVPVEKVLHLLEVHLAVEATLTALALLLGTGKR